MPTLYMTRTPGTTQFPGLGHLIEGRVYDNVSKEDAAALIEAKLAEEFDDDNETHAASVADRDPEDARKPEPKKAAPVKASAKATDYEAMTAEQLHAEAGKRNIEGRSSMDRVALAKALEKDDAKNKK